MLKILRLGFQQYGLPALFVWIFLFAGLGLLGWSLWSSLEALNSRAWPTVLGTITRADISTLTSDSDVMYIAEIRYVYRINGQDLRGSQVTFGDLSSSDRRHPERLVARYPVGATVQVYYNPRDPLEAVLEPGLTTGLLLPLGLGAGFTLAGGGMAFGLVHRLSAERTLNGE